MQKSTRSGEIYRQWTPKQCHPPLFWCRWAETGSSATFESGAPGTGVELLTSDGSGAALYHKEVRRLVVDLPEDTATWLFAISGVCMQTVVGKFFIPVFQNLSAASSAMRA